MAEIKLLPCPFCGGKAKEVIIRSGIKLAYRIRCANIACTVRPTTPYFEDLNEAVRKWNNRATEVEVRAKTIEEVMAKAKEIQKEQIKNLEQSCTRNGKQWAVYMNTHLGHIQVACKRLLAEQLKENEDKASEARQEFMDIVYDELADDADNYRANRIIDAFDTYAPYQKGE